METSFCELRGKEVINVVDGKRLGKIIDIVFDTRFGKVLGIVVPCYNKSWNIFKQCDDIFIPFNNVCKFGEDAILVQIYIPNQNSTPGKNRNRNGIFNNKNTRTCTAENVNESEYNLSMLSAPNSFDANSNNEKFETQNNQNLQNGTYNQNTNSITTPPPLYPDG